MIYINRNRTVLARWDGGKHHLVRSLTPSSRWTSGMGKSKPVGWDPISEEEAKERVLKAGGVW